MTTARAGLGELFIAARPGPKHQPKKDAARARVIELRRQRHGLDEIAAELERAGTPLSRTAVWEILGEAGLARMPKPPAGPTPPPEPERLAVLPASDRTCGSSIWRSRCPGWDRY